MNRGVRLVVTVLAGLWLAGAARAGSSVCWIQNGVLLVPAVAAGVNGVFILDTGQAQSQLDATQASEADIGASPVVGDVRVANRAFAHISLSVEALDSRTRSFPTPIAGVLGADVLGGQVLDVRPDPCRVRLEPADRRRAGGMALTLRAGVPYVRAGASDGMRSDSGLFRLSTGSPAATSALEADHRLRALSVGGVLFENIAAAPTAAVDAGSAGVIGESVWSRFKMRLDLKRKRLWLTPEPLRNAVP